MIKSLSILATIALFFVLTTQAASAIEVSYLPLVPCGLNSQPAGKTDDYTHQCTRCDFLHLGKNLIDMIFLGIVPVLGTLFFLWAGFNYMLAGAIPSRKAAALNLFKNTIYGIVVVSLAWAITNTLITTVAKAGVVGGASGWWNLSCTATIPPEDTGIVSPPTNGGTAAEQAARSLLSAAGISVNKPAPATQLEGMRQATLDEVLRLHAACGCAITITGGTEPGHAESGTMTHASGYKVDVRITPELDAYINKACTQTTTRSDGAIQYKCGSATYARESDHWDILVP